MAAKKNQVAPAAVKVSEDGMLHLWYTRVVSRDEVRALVGLPPMDESTLASPLIDVPSTREVDGRRWLETTSKR